MPQENMNWTDLMTKQWKRKHCWKKKTVSSEHFNRASNVHSVSTEKYFVFQKRNWKLKFEKLLLRGKSTGNFKASCFRTNISCLSPALANKIVGKESFVKFVIGNKISKHLTYMIEPSKEYFAELFGRLNFYAAASFT